MYQLILIIIFSLCLISFQNQLTETQNKIVEGKVNPVPKPTIEKEKKEGKKLVETFIDKIKIGVPRKHKIELNHIQNFGKTYENFVKIKFYSKNKNGKWKLRQNFEIEKDGELPLLPEFDDFNNDGFKDITFVSGEAGRGANQIRKLLIYDKKKDKLIHIKNSDDYPNLGYNKRLNSLNAWVFTGSTRTDFVRIVGDELKIFAQVVDYENEREIFVYDKDGNEKLLRKEKRTPKEGYQKYKNYDPLEPASHP